MSDIVTVAALLAQRLGKPPFHAVWVQNGPEMDDKGELIRTIRVAIRPGAKIQVPATFMEYPIHREEWPEGV